MMPRRRQDWKADLAFPRLDADDKMTRDDNDDKQF
jgi:hypothetical protein